eukprot:2519950-Rhodomonas_salina.6
MRRQRLTYRDIHRHRDTVTRLHGDMQTQRHTHTNTPRHRLTTPHLSLQTDSLAAAALSSAPLLPLRSRHRCEQPAEEVEGEARACEGHVRAHVTTLQPTHRLNPTGAYPPQPAHQNVGDRRLFRKGDTCLDSWPCKPRFIAHEKNTREGHEDEGQQTPKQGKKGGERERNASEREESGGRLTWKASKRCLASCSICCSFSRT